ncbi:MAG: hypothetical protein B7Z70_10300 [Acidithiobacillus ferrivorans]|uniref:Uncharacterized protein n=1 Tax=Acidithiobacillus ferrivorans TaxID=160808 RepID=A0A257SUQ9_9PROT|nr:MAG: hypothetical protein B7Z70_10300 [Acidithiobacillus ferrivorans]
MHPILQQMGMTHASFMAAPPPPPIYSADRGAERGTLVPSERLTKAIEIGEKNPYHNVGQELQWLSEQFFLSGAVNASAEQIAQAKIREEEMMRRASKGGAIPAEAMSLE